MRRILGVVAAGAVAVIGGFIFGEQSFSGPLGAIIGGLLGLFVAEAAVLATGERSSFTAVVSAVFALAGTALAVAIFYNRFHARPAPLPWGAWAALAAAALVAALTGRTSRKTVPGSSPGP